MIAARGSHAPLVPTQIVRGLAPSRQSAAEVRAEFRALLAAGAVLEPQGDAASEPERMLRSPYLPRQAVDLFDVRYYLSGQRECPEFRFMVGYVVPRAGRRRRKLIPRIFYKDTSLVWRVATHLIRTETENWIGKGDVKWVREGGEQVLYSAEETTNLPHEIQTAFDRAGRAGGRTVHDLAACEWVLRRAPEHRMAPYSDFSAPRRRAFSNPRNRIHGGKPVARFTRAGDPRSLRFVRGYEPDFHHGVLEIDRLSSHMYGGDVDRLRILSQNRRIQYGFLRAPKHCWILPPQPLTTELNPYGVRTLDAVVDDDLCVPGYEYHFLADDRDPPQWISQIPAGYAGPASDVDPTRASAMPWLEKLAVIRDFRRARIRRPNARV